jgi:glycogen debranching enzyme
LPREQFAFPVSYPTSCSPQAWAAASPLLFLRSMLHFDPDVRNAQLHLAPDIPEWIGPLALSGVPLMGGHLSIEVEGARCSVLELPQGLKIVPEPRRATV